MRVIKTTVVVVMVLAGAGVLSGCPATMSGSAYTRDQVQQAQEVRLGYVESVRPVMIEGTKSGVGAVSGAALGGVAGSSIGKGKGQVAGAVGGAVLGGLAGSTVGGGRGQIAATVGGAVAGGAAGNAIAGTTRAGVEVTVQLDNGRTVAVVQEGSPDQFRAGDRVNVASDGVTTRVTRL